MIPPKIEGKEMSRQKAWVLTVMAIAALSLIFYFSGQAVGAGRNVNGGRISAAAQRDDGAGAAAFTDMGAVLHHPRCMNCHSRGDFPRQADDGHPHTMNVRRGPEGKGVTSQKCRPWHQDPNVEGLNRPPGAPDW